MNENTPLPKTWEELLALQELLPETHRIVLRNSEDNDYYSLFREVIPKELQLQLIRKQAKGESIALLPNRFPYTRLLTYLSDVEHWCLWSTSGPLDEETIAQKVTERFPDQKWFATESKFKSMPEIWHTHVFVKK